VKAKNNHALFSLFDNNIVCGDDPNITRGKPAPDIFHVARERLGSPPAKNCLVFEDAINGVEAAKNAEMNVSLQRLQLCLKLNVVSDRRFF